MKTHRTIVWVAMTLLPLAVAIATPTITLLTPPPDRYNLYELWQVTITNSEVDSYKVQLKGTITEAKKGVVFTGLTKEFWVRPKTTKQLKYGDAELTMAPGYPTYAPGYKEFAERTQGLPEGTYEFSVWLLPDFGGDSTKIVVKPRQPIRLIAPQGSVSSKTPTFVWSPPPGEPNASYVIGVKQVLPGQTPMQAWNTNPWFHVVRDINTTSLMWPMSAPAFDSGRTYVWSGKWYPRGMFKWPWPWPFPLPDNWVSFPEPDTFLFIAGGGGGGFQWPDLTARDHTVFMKDVLRHALGRGGIISQLRDVARREQVPTNEEILQAALRSPAIPDSSKAIARKCLTVLETIRPKMDSLPPAASRAIAMVSAAIDATRNIDDLIAALAAVKASGEYDSIPGMPNAIDVAMQIVRGGSSTIYLPGSGYPPYTPPDKDTVYCSFSWGDLGKSDVKGVIAGGVGGAITGSLLPGAGTLAGAGAGAVGGGVGSSTANAVGQLTGWWRGP
jgi:hypothetical protein